MRDSKNLPQDAVDMARAFIADYARRNDGDVTAGADFLKGPLDTMPEIVDEALRPMQEFPQARRARVA